MEAAASSRSKAVYADARDALLNSPKVTDRLLMVTTVATSLLLVVSLILFFHYLRFPTGQPILMGHAIIPLNNLVAGCLVITSILAIFGLICARTCVKRAWGREVGRLVYSKQQFQEGIRQILHPNGRTAPITPEEAPRIYHEIQRIKVQMGASQGRSALVEYKTDDNVALRGIWFRGESINGSFLGTVIVFHGNGQSVTDMTDWADYYRGRGYHVLLASYRGYPLCGGVCAQATQEIDAQMDALAAYKFAKNHELHTGAMIAHGYSLGGAYAAVLAEHNLVDKLILSHTFTSFENVMAEKVPPLTHSSAAFTSLAAYEPAKRKVEVEEGREVELETDGWNTLNKIRFFNGQAFVMRGATDKLMPLKFGEELLGAAFRSNKEHLVTIAGGHCDLHNFFEDGAAQRAFHSFLCQ